MSRRHLLGRLFGEQAASQLKPERSARLSIETLEAREMPSINWGDYASRLADISAPAKVKAGDYVTVSVTNKYPAAISMSYADLDEVYLNGAKVDARGGIATIYAYGYDPKFVQPVPVGGAKIDLPAGNHSIKFQINEDAPDDKVEITGEYGSWGRWAHGPFVVVGGNFVGKPWSSVRGFEVDGDPRNQIALAVAQISPSGAVAKPGDVVTYRLTARVPRTDIQEFALTTFVPYGSTLLRGSFVGGEPSISGSRLTWKKTADDAVRNTISVVFKVKVKPEQQLFSTRTLKLNATARYIDDDGDSQSRAAKKELKLVRATQISGVVRDVKLNFPASNSVQSNLAMANATVVLRKTATGKIVDETTTDGAGKYQIQAPEPGVYILEISCKVDHYNFVAKEILAEANTIEQRRQIVITKDRTEPFKVDEILLPVQLLNRTAEVMKKLDDVRPQILAGFVNVIGEAVLPDFMRFGYDLKLVAQLRNLVIARGIREEFRIYDGTGTKDTLNGLIRVTAFMETLALRLDQSLKHADIAGKALALFIATNLIPAIGAMLPQKQLTDVEKVTKFGFLNLKIVTMGVVIPQTLKVVFEQFNLSPKARDFISAIVFNVARYAFDRFTHQTVDDLLFELIFTTIRTGATAAYLQATIKGFMGTRGTQAALDETAWMAQRRVYSGPTNDVLAHMERLWGKVSDRAAFVENVSGQAQTVLNYARLITGLRDVYMGGSAATGTPVKPGGVGMIGKLFDKLNEKVIPIQGSPQNATRMQKFLSGFKATMFYLLPLYALPIGLPVLELYAVDPIMEAIGRGSMSGPVEGDIDPPPSTSYEEMLNALVKWAADNAGAMLFLA